MSVNTNDALKLLRIPSVEERHQLQTNPSTISFETVNVPTSLLDILNDIYSSRTHRRCINISYFTLLSMTLTVVFWISYWLTYNRCNNVKDPQLSIFLCDLYLIFEVLTFTCISISPFLFVFMIYCWIMYSCYNPLDSIRENFLGFKIEGEQWKEQLDYYYRRKKTRCFNCFRCKQRRELQDRGYGYIILSPHGIIIDELIILTGTKNILDNVILLHVERMLKLTFKKTCKRPWKIEIEMYLPEHLINRRAMEEIMEILKIQVDIDAIHPPCF